MRCLSERSRIFRARCLVRPDIVVECADRRIMLDTKWKTPINNAPADPDLKQCLPTTGYSTVRNHTFCILRQPRNPRLDPAHTQKGRANVPWSTSICSTISTVCEETFWPMWSELSVCDTAFSLRKGHLYWRPTHRGAT